MGVLFFLYSLITNDFVGNDLFELQSALKLVLPFNLENS